MTDSNPTDRNIAVLTHLGGILFSFLPSLIVWLLKKDDNAWLGEQAREALNFQITVLIGYVVAWVLAFVLIGLILLPAIYVVNLVLCIIAAAKISQGVDYRYPFALRLIS